MRYEIFRLLKDYIDENPDRIEKVTVEELERNRTKKEGLHGDNADGHSDRCCIEPLCF